MQLQHVSKSKFKAGALDYMRLVESSKKPLIITHFGKPVINITPHIEPQKKSNLYALRGTLLKYERPMDPVGLEDWEALK